MPIHDDLGIRMKTFYEQVPKTRLIRRMPVAIRIDGKTFHTFTRGFDKPFDWVLISAMQRTAKYLCKNIQGCVLSYQQSDEITLILVDYATFDTAAWCDYEVQKLCSVAASMATMAFNKFFKDEIEGWRYGASLVTSLSPEELERRLYAYDKAIERGAMFDARCFNIPKEEVTNLIYWRQLDATRNSIQMVGQYYMSRKELHGKSCNEIQNILLTEYNVNWNQYPITCKRGSCCIKTPKSGPDMTRWVWTIDNNIPIFKGDGREYIDNLI